MAMAKRQKREKPEKIEQRKVRGTQEVPETPVSTREEARGSRTHPGEPRFRLKALFSYFFFLKLYYLPFILKSTIHLELILCMV